MPKASREARRIRWQEVYEFAERGSLVSFEDLSAHCNSEAELRELRLRYPLVLQAARASLVRELQEATKQKAAKKFVVNLLASSLAFAWLSTTISICYLALTGRDAPNVLVSITSALLGYLAGIVTGITGLTEKRGTGKPDKNEPVI